MGSDQFEIEGFPLKYGEDAEVVMHRDSHFAGSFELMLEYYSSGGIGVMEEFSLRRIAELATFERMYGENIATLLLTEPDLERVVRSRRMYQELKALSQLSHSKTQIPRLIADLILTEEAEPVAEIEAIVFQGKAAIPFLLDLLKSEDLKDPLFPGYGMAPSHAVTCLKQLGDKKTIIALFELIGQSEFADEEQLLSALYAIGEPARDFLLQVVKSKPVTLDNERAATALVSFKDDPLVSKSCLEVLLQLKDIRCDLFFATYLVLVCEGLKDGELRESFRKLMQRSDVPKAL